MNDINKQEREKIFETFIEHHKQKFSEIEKRTSIISNKLSYHLKAMVTDELLVKKDDCYILSSKAEKLIPFFAHITGQEIGNLCIVLCAILNKDKTRIFLMNRKKRPYKGYWGLIGGKIQIQDSIFEAAKREIKEETNLDCDVLNLNAVLHERVKEKEEFKHAFVIFLVSLTPRKSKESEYDTDEGMVKWFDIENLEIDKEQVIPSDYYMIMNLLDKKVNIKEVIQEDEDGKLLDMTIKDI